MNNIRVAREAKGVSQKEVAITLGVSRPTVSEWESGKKNPSRKRLLELSQFYSCTIDYLLGRDEALPPIQKEKADPRNELTKRQKDLLELFGEASEKIQSAIIDILQDYVNKDTKSMSIERNIKKISNDEKE